MLDRSIVLSAMIGLIVGAMTTVIYVSAWRRFQRRLKRFRGRPFARISLHLLLDVGILLVFLGLVIIADTLSEHVLRVGYNAQLFVVAVCVPMGVARIIGARRATRERHSLHREFH